MLTLPEDIIHEICQHLHVKGVLGLNRERNYDPLTRKTLASLALASKACYRAARAALHHTVDIQCYKSEAGLKLLKQCIARPETADMVRVVFAGSWENYIDREMKRCAKRKNAPISDSPALHAIIASLGVSDTLAEKLREGIVLGWQEAETALLLGLFRRMHELHLGLEHGLDESLVMAVVKETQANRLASQDESKQSTSTAAAAAAELQPRSYECIRYLEVEYWDTEGAADLEELVPLLQLPYLETLEGFQLCYETVTETPAVAWTSNLRKLDLQHTVANNGSVGQVLRRCPNLQVLSIHWGNEQDAGRDGDEAEVLTYNGLGNVLRQYGGKLIALRLDAKTPFDLFPIGPLLGSLSAMKSLQLLSVRADAMFVLDDSKSLREPDSNMANLLPPSLKRLRVEISCFAPVKHVKTVQRYLRRLQLSGDLPVLESVYLLRESNIWHSEKDIMWEDADSDGYWMGDNKGDALPLSYEIRGEDKVWHVVFENTDDPHSHPQAPDLSEWFGLSGRSLQS